MTGRELQCRLIEIMEQLEWFCAADENATVNGKIAGVFRDLSDKIAEGIVEKHITDYQYKKIPVEDGGCVIIDIRRKTKRKINI